MRRVMMTILVVFILIGAIRAEFTSDFEGFLKRNYGAEFAEQMTRIDMGPGPLGSFGGKFNAEEEISKRPIVFIHGVTSRASFFLPHIEFFRKHNYSLANLYATTYADGGRTPMVLMDMRCEDVILIRNFTRAVAAYTNSTVNIIAHSMGVGIGRKAILGGSCVDTEEFLGGPLTHLVENFIGVAGVTYGLEYCPEFLHDCNKKNGLVCDSDFLIDVNSQSKKFEGNRTFVIYSPDDPIIGRKCCGHQCSDINFNDGMSRHPGLDHLGIVYFTMDVQLKLVEGGTI
uniref:Lipase domain-containing protein n=1 Tax=Panagrellus redivivus TaxID=6233 RepID=A0A7E4VRE4_PANRE